MNPRRQLLLLLLTRSMCLWILIIDVAIHFVFSFPIVLQQPTTVTTAVSRLRKIRHNQQPPKRHLLRRLNDVAFSDNVAVTLSVSDINNSIINYNTAFDEKYVLDTSCTNTSTASTTSNTGTTASKPKQQLGSPICLYDQLTIPLKLSSTVNAADDIVIPQQEIIVYDLTKQIQQFVSDNQYNIQCGTITLFNRHTTTSLLINEYESRLVRDMQATFLKFIPPDVRSYAYQKATPGLFPNTTYYEHNDIQLRPESVEETLRCYENGYNISNTTILQQWRKQEPINAHSHLLSMMIGSNSLTIPIHNHSIQIGQWQSIMLIDFDGPRHGRTIGIQVMGYER